MSRKDGMFNCQHISDEGVAGQWEKKYLQLTESNLIVKENADDNIVRSTIHLCDIVYVERDSKPKEISLDKPNTIEKLDDSTNTGQVTVEMADSQETILIHIKARYKSEWKIEMESEDIYQEWYQIFKRKQGIMREIDINPPPPKRYSKPKYTFRTFYDNRKLLGERWMILAFIAYTAILVVLFSILWTKYVLPEKNIVEIESQCFIQSANSVYVYKRNYDLEILVTYKLESGESLTNLMYQYCSGNGCPSFMEDNYKVGTTVTCHYDEADPSYVFFDLSQMVRKRYTITFGVCGGLLGPWLIFVLVMGFLSRKKIAQMFKDSCCPDDED
ncbi:hypothetical protein RB653_003343 [Dictyostelium firmibasis]|uniref:PH domain-containing protein n=1 Tax=Dictyostelium firmibasis TaxID=79012 RepID=A0AAN7Z2D8_9MYCE